MPFKIRLGKRSQQYTLSSKELTIVPIELVDHTKVIECTIHALTTGRECLQNVCQRLHIQDDQYFGLLFTTKKRRFQWIDMDKPVKKQLDKYSDTIRLFMRIQFYVPDVEMLYDDATRSFYYCQLKAHVLEGRLRFDREELVSLAAYALQVEFGDYDPDRHTKEFLANNALFPRYLLEPSTPFTSSKEITDALIESLVAAYRSLQSIQPNIAELVFISLVQSLDLLGQEGFPAKDASDSSEANLGVYLKGIFAVKENGISQFPWTEIVNLIHDKRTLVIELSPNPPNSVGEKHEYILHDTDITRYAWKVCVDQHQFFMKGTSFNTYNLPSSIKPSDSDASDGHSQKDLALNHTVPSTSNAASNHQSTVASPQAANSTTVILPKSSSKIVSPSTIRQSSLEDSFTGSTYLNQSNLDTSRIDLNCQSSPQIGSMSHFNSNSVNSIASINGGAIGTCIAGGPNVTNIHQVDSVSSLRDPANSSWQNLIQSSRNNLANIQSHITGSSMANINDSNNSIASNVVNNNNHTYSNNNNNNNGKSVTSNNNNNNSNSCGIYSNSKESQLSLLSSLLASANLDANSNLNNNRIEYSDYVNGAAIDFAVKNLTEAQNRVLLDSSPQVNSGQQQQQQQQQQQRSQLLQQLNASASSIIQSKLNVNSVPIISSTDAANLLMRKSSNDSDPIYANANACKSLNALASSSGLLNGLIGHSSSSNIDFLTSIASNSPSLPPPTSDSFETRPLSYKERLAHLPPYKDPPSYDEYVQKKYGIDGVMLPYDVAAVGTSIGSSHLNGQFHHNQCGILMSDKVASSGDCGPGLFEPNDSSIACKLNSDCKSRRSISKMNRFTSQSVGSLSTTNRGDLDYEGRELGAQLMKAYWLQQKFGYNASSDAFHLYQNLNFNRGDLMNASTAGPVDGQSIDHRANIEASESNGGLFNSSFETGYTIADESIYSTVKPKSASGKRSTGSPSLDSASNGHLVMANGSHCIGDYTQRSLTLNESNNPYSVKASTTVPISLSMDEIGPVTDINTSRGSCNGYNSSLLKVEPSTGIIMGGGAIELPGSDSSSGYLNSNKNIHELNLKLKLSTSTGMTGSTVSGTSTAAAATATATTASASAIASGPTCTSTSVSEVATGSSGYTLLLGNSNAPQVAKVEQNTPNLAVTCNPLHPTSETSVILDMNPTASTATPPVIECKNRINLVGNPSSYFSDQNHIRHLNNNRQNCYTSAGSTGIQLNQFNSSHSIHQQQQLQQQQQQLPPQPQQQPPLPAPPSACHFIPNHSSYNNYNGPNHNSHFLNQTQQQTAANQVPRQLGSYNNNLNNGQQRNQVTPGSSSVSGGGIPNYLLAHQQLVQQQRQQFLIRSQGVSTTSTIGSTSVNVTGVTYPSTSSSVGSTSVPSQYQVTSGSLQRHLFNNCQQSNTYGLHQLPPGQLQQRTPQLTQVSINSSRRNNVPSYGFQSVPDLTQPVQANVVRGQSFSQYAQSKVGPMGSGPQMCLPVESKSQHQQFIQPNLQQQRKGLITGSVNALPSIVSGVSSSKFIASPSNSGSGYSVVTKAQQNRRIFPPGSGSVPNLPNMMMASEQQQASNLNGKITLNSKQGVSNACLLSVPMTVASSETGQPQYATGDSGITTTSHRRPEPHHNYSASHNAPHSNSQVTCGNSQVVTPSATSCPLLLPTGTSSMSLAPTILAAADSSKATFAQVNCSSASSPSSSSGGGNAAMALHATSNVYNCSRETGRGNISTTTSSPSSSCPGAKEKANDTCVNNEYNSQGKSDKSLYDTGTTIDASSYCGLYDVSSSHITNVTKESIFTAAAVSCESSTMTPATMTSTTVTSPENGKVTYEVLPCTSSSPLTASITVPSDLVAVTSTKPSVTLSSNEQVTGVKVITVTPTLGINNNLNSHESYEQLPIKSKLEVIRNELQLQQQQLMLQQQQLQQRSQALSVQAKNLANSDLLAARKKSDVIIVHTGISDQPMAKDEVIKHKQQMQVIDSNFRPTSEDKIDQVTLSTKHNNIPVTNSSSHPVPQPRTSTVTAAATNKPSDLTDAATSSNVTSSTSLFNVTMTLDNQMPHATSSSTNHAASSDESIDLHKQEAMREASPTNGNIQRGNRPKNLYEGTSPVQATKEESDSITVSTPTKVRSSDPRIAKIEAHMASPYFRKEFEDIPRKDATAAITTALLPENLSRNRFMDILPYEFNRVRVECGKDNRSKYINASHVTINIGGSVHRYIAAQGPLSDTVVEFWQAVWTNKVSVIVMVTELEEGGHEKCFKYFPSEVGTRVTFGPFTIQCKSSEHTLSYVTSDFSVTHIPSNFTRDIRHIRYTDWQDHTCPHVGAFIEFLDHIDALNRTFNRGTGGSLRSTSLLDSTGSSSSNSSNTSKSSKLSSLFSSFSRSKSKLNQIPASPTSSTSSSSHSNSSNSSLPPVNGNNYHGHHHDHNSSSPPLLVHCSAGVGRSGVVILCDALIRSLDSVNGEINVPEVLTQLRKQRMNSVQNFTQYCFVYRVLIHYLHNSRLI